LLGDVPEIQKRYLEILDNVKALNPNVRPILMFQYRPDVRNDPYRIYKILGTVGNVVTAVQILSLLTIAVSVIALAAFKINILACGLFILISGISSLAISRIVPFRATIGILKGQNPGITMIGALMKKFYRPLLERAKKDNLPILDLPNSFNPYEAMYISGIEPSKEGARAIAEGICQIIKGSNDALPGHDYTSGKIYRCDGQVNSIQPDNWKVEYVSSSD
jgi:hypothetical protein